MYKSKIYQPAYMSKEIFMLYIFKVKFFCSSTVQKLGQFKCNRLFFEYYRISKKKKKKKLLKF